jgi:thiol-disulfide isomerase/thioredoxin
MKISHLLSVIIFLGLVVSLAYAADKEENLISIGGVIVDENDTPVAGVHAEFLADESSGPDFHAETVTGADGKWQIEIPERHSTLSWQLQHPDFALSTTYSWLRVTDDLKAGTMRHTIKRGSPVNGLVVNEEGTPLENVAVVYGHYNIDSIAKLREEIETGKTGNVVLTDANGQFAMLIPENGRDNICFFTEGYAPEVRTMDDVEKVVLNTGVTWSGVVQDVDSAVLEGVRVCSNHWNCTNPNSWMSTYFYECKTDADGKFSIANLPKTGTVDFGILKKGFFDRSVTWSPETAQEKNNAYILYPSSPIRGTVVDAATGEPVTDFDILPYFSKKATSVTSLPCDMKKHITNRRGRFMFEIDANFGEKPGAIALYITAPKYHRAVIDPVYALDFGKPMEIKLEPGEPIIGKVLDPAGAPAADADIMVVHRDECALIQGYKINTDIIGAPYNTTTSDPSGLFQLMPSKGPGMLLALHTSGWALCPLEEYTPDAPLSLNAWNRIEGQVSMDNRMEGEKTSIAANVIMPEEWKIDRSVQFSLYSPVDENGKYAIDHVPSLPLQVGESRRWMTSHAQSLTPTPGETITLNFPGDHPGAVKGQLSISGWENPEEDLTESWNSSRRLIINARPKGADPEDEYVNFVPLVQKDGTFTLNGLPAGEYELTAVIHLLPPPNTCGRGAAIAELKHTFSITAEQNTPSDLGTLTFTAIEHPKPGQTAPGIEGKRIGDDTPWQLGSECGKPVLLTFWATWCAPCRAELPTLQKLWETYGEAEKLQIVGLNLDWDMKRLSQFMDAENPPWPQYQIGKWDENNPVTRAYGMNYLPSNWLLDADGVILEANIPSDELEAVIKKHCGS